MSNSPPRPPKWKTDDLYLFLMEAFPEHLTPYNRLDVNRLAGDLGRSYEALYQKLRKGKLTLEWARMLSDLSNNEDRLVESAECHARTLTENLHTYVDGDAEVQDEMMQTAVISATAAVRKRFADGREPLTLEQDFIRFFI